MSNNQVAELAEHALDYPHLMMDQQVHARTASLSHALALVEAQKRDLEAALLARDDIQRQLENELEDAHMLHDISAMLVDEDNVDALFQKLVDVATTIMRSDFGSIQRYDPDRNALQLIAHRGLNDEALAFWHWVSPGQATTCGHALEQAARVVVPDFETCDFIVGTRDGAAFKQAGVRSAQSTPLLTRNGRLVGMITTHCIRHCEPTARDLRLLDIVARQAADLIERNAASHALRQHAGQLLEADRFKNEFLATLAHELRNPLAPIRNGVAILKLGKPEHAPRVLAMMERQLGQMVHLIDDLLDVSRISRGVITLKPSRVLLADLVASAVETSQPALDAARHHFTAAVPALDAWLDVDAVRVVQIISNLLNNATKYTPSGGRIDLSVDVAETAVAIRIADNGIGISAAMLPAIFELFTQVDGAADCCQGGLGVGLALSKKLAEMHGGRIDADSAGVNAGSVFTLHLPRAV